MLQPALLTPLLLLTSQLMGQLTGWTGTWIGTGSSHDSAGWQADCDSMQFDLIQTPESFQVLSGTYRCGSLRSHWKPVSIEIRGTELWRDGHAIGSFEGNRIKTFARSAGGKYLQTFEITLIDDELTTMLYHEEWREASDETPPSAAALVVEGKLTRDSGTKP